MVRRGWRTAQRRHPSRQRGPTTAPPPDTPPRWPERKWVARLIRLVAFVFPIVVSFLIALGLSRNLGVPDGFWPRVLRWLLIAAIATVAMIVVQRLLRRMLPLAALFSLTLVFPDETPSRFGLALRGMSARQLDKQMADLDGELDGGVGETPQEAAEKLLALVAQLSRHDRLTRGHSERVRAYALMIGEEMDLPDDELDQLRWAALLHDIGKLAVPAAILTKPGQLTDDEFELVRTHPGAGRDLVEPLAGWLGPAAAAVYEHHERWEGGGYPTGVAASTLALTTGVVSVADAFDVMTSARSYKAPETASAARAELQRCAGSQFDPDVVRAMMNISLGKLWRAMGPLSWGAQIGLFPRGATQGGPAVSAVVAAITSLLLAGLAVATNSPPPDAVTAIVPSIVDPPSEREPESEAAPQSRSSPPSPPSPPSPQDAAAPPSEPPVSTAPPATAMPVEPPTVIVVTTFTTTTIPTIPTITLPRVTTTLAPTTTTPVAGTTVTTPVPTTTLPPDPPPATTTAPPATTTPPPATAPPTTAPPTTTTLPPPPPPGQYTVAAAGAGDQVSMPLLSLEPLRAPVNPTVPNLDTDRDDDPGLWLEPAGRNLFDPKPNLVQTWLFPDSMVGVIGPVSFQSWIAPAGDLGGGGVDVRSGIFDCDLARTDCDRLVRDTQTVMGAPGEFMPVTFDLGLLEPYVADPDRRLELRMAVTNNQTDDVWVGFDADDTPSTLTIAQP